MLAALHAQREEMRRRTASPCASLASPHEEHGRNARHRRSIVPHNQVEGRKAQELTGAKVPLVSVQQQRRLGGGASGVRICKRGHGIRGGRPCMAVVGRPLAASISYARLGETGRSAASLETQGERSAAVSESQDNKCIRRCTHQGQKGCERPPWPSQSAGQTALQGGA